MDGSIARLFLIALAAVPLLVLISCAQSRDEPPRLDESEFAKRRAAMVKSQLESREIEPRVLEVMKHVPRHKFVPSAIADRAYEDRALSIGEGQTISQPYIVALMTQLADPQPGDIALDVGTGSGYQAAVLSKLVDRVYSIEIVPELAEQASNRLKQLGYENIDAREGDGYKGWPEHAPFDVIILAAAPSHVPPALVEQLAKGGRLVLPVGEQGGGQYLLLIRKADDGTISETKIAPVAFVPMTGEARKEQ